jgi:hypothetical protein
MAWRVGNFRRILTEIHSKKTFQKMWFIKRGGLKTILQNLAEFFFAIVSCWKTNFLMKISTIKN